MCDDAVYRECLGIPRRAGAESALWTPNPAVQLLRTAPQTLLTSAHLHPNPHAQDVRLTGGTDHQAHQESHLAGWGPGG